jgi:hypothetical protein
VAAVAAEPSVPDSLPAVRDHGVGARSWNTYSAGLDPSATTLIIGCGESMRLLIADHCTSSRDRWPWSPGSVSIRRNLAASFTIDLLIGRCPHRVWVESVSAAQLAHCFSILPKVGLVPEDDLSARHLDAAGSTRRRAGALWCGDQRNGPAPVHAALFSGSSGGSHHLVASTDSHSPADI